MGRHRYTAESTAAADVADVSDDAEAADPEDWEEAPPTAPLWRFRIVTSAVLLLAVVAGTWWAVGWLTSPAGPTGSGAPEAAPVEEPLPDAGPTVSADTVTVHVAGEVADPGLVELPADARVQDALEAAGGPTEDAVVDLLNLAAPAVDGSQILVPGSESVAGGSATDVPAGGAVAGGAAGGAAGGVRGAGSEGGAGAVNVNTADSAGLEQLPGIGPALAGRIIDHREQVGPFGSLEDLDAVSGIGPAMMEQLDGLVSW